MFKSKIKIYKKDVYFNTPPSKMDTVEQNFLKGMNSNRLIYNYMYYKNLYFSDTFSKIDL